MNRIAKEGKTNSFRNNTHTIVSEEPMTLTVIEANRDPNRLNTTAPNKIMMKRTKTKTSNVRRIVSISPSPISRNPVKKKPEAATKQKLLPAIGRLLANSAGPRAVVSSITYAMK